MSATKTIERLEPANIAEVLGTASESAQLSQESNASAAMPLPLETDAEGEAAVPLATVIGGHQPQDVSLVVEDALQAMAVDDVAIARPDDAAPCDVSQNTESVREFSSPSVPVQTAWRNLPAQNAWCPQELRLEYPSLEAYNYADNQGFLHTSTKSLWQAFGATRRGRSHANDGAHREDALHFEANERFAVAVVSDGAGSSALSRIGSYVTCSQGVAAMTNLLGTLAVDVGEQELAASIHKFVGVTLRSICSNLERLAAIAKVKPREFNCTFLLALAYRSEKTELLAVSQVGDGLVALERIDGEIVHPCEPDAGPQSGQVTCFVPMGDAPARALTKLSFHRAVSISRIILATDGIEDAFYPTKKKLPLLLGQLDRGVDEPMDGFLVQPKHGPVFGSERPDEVLATWLGFEMRGENDDRTLLAMHRRRGT